MSPTQHKPKKILSYSVDTLREAVSKVFNKELGFNQAAKLYGIPRGTLHDKVHLRTPLAKSSPGPDPYLSNEMEEKLCDWIKEMSRIGYGKTRSEIPLVVKTILDESGNESKFKDNLPSSGWMSGFLARHKELASRIPENLGHHRAQVNYAAIEDWFINLKEYVEINHKMKIEDFLTTSKGIRIWNADETGFPLQGSSGRLQVLANKGSKHIYRRTIENKEQLTVLGCCSASGLFMKPLVIFPGKRLKVNLKGVDPSLVDLARSDNGWITSNIFFEWISNQFYPYLQNIDVQFPIILFIDGHKSHVNLGTSIFCREKGIILYCFRAHASHIQQPLDVAVYGPLKSKWNSMIRKWTLENPLSTLTKTKFLPIFLEAWNEGTKPNNAVSGFRATGLVPYDISAIDKSKFPNSLSQSRPYFDILNKVPIQKAASPKSSDPQCVFKIIEKHASPYIKTFEQLYESNEELIEDNDAKTMLFNIYKDTRKLIGENKNIETLPSTSTSVDRPNHKTISPPQKIRDNSPLESVTLNEAEKIVFENYKVSPFKKYLSLPEYCKPKETTQKGINKLDFPDVISGESMIIHLQKKEETKRLLENQKLERKKQREENKRRREEEKIKKMNNKKLKRSKNSKAKNRKTEEPDTEDSMSIPSESSEDYNDDDIDLMTCKVCRTRDGENCKWIECDLCCQWFHIQCLNMENHLFGLSEYEIKNLEFICHDCQSTITT